MAERAIGSIGSDGSIYYGSDVFGPSEADLLLASQNLDSPRKVQLPKFAQKILLTASLGLTALACAPSRSGEVNAAGTVPAGVGTSQACNPEEFVREQGYHAIPVDIGPLPVEIDIIYRRDNQCLGRSTSDIVRVGDFLARLEEQRRAEEVRQAAVAATAIAQAQAAEATATAQARPTETPTPRPTATSTPRPAPIPTSTPPRQEPTVQPTPEVRETVKSWPIKIGNLTIDRIEINNRGNSLGVTSSNWGEIVHLGQKIAPNGTIFYFYDWTQVNLVPDHPGANYDQNIRWGQTYALSPDGKHAFLKSPDGSFEYHTTLPRNFRVGDLNHDLDRIIVTRLCGSGSSNIFILTCDDEATELLRRSLKVADQDKSNLKAILPQK